jgi:hypothetical protein
MAKRPMISTYEEDADGVEQLVYREMNDEEYKEYCELQEAHKNAPEPEHPLITQVKSMDKKDRAELKRLLK